MAIRHVVGQAAALVSSLALFGGFVGLRAGLFRPGDLIGKDRSATATSVAWADERHGDEVSLNDSLVPWNDVLSDLPTSAVAVDQQHVSSGHAVPEEKYLFTERRPAGAVQPAVFSSKSGVINWSSQVVAVNEMLTRQLSNESPLDATPTVAVLPAVISSKSLVIDWSPQVVTLNQALPPKPASKPSKDESPFQSLVPISPETAIMFGGSKSATGVIQVQPAVVDRLFRSLWLNDYSALPQPSADSSEPQP
ncbi:MAG: hypothetical protein SH850_20195 [Planctomycetaceae bacterium]|nr:hypothetical protein [Planctomycetaceae bacterium]